MTAEQSPSFAEWPWNADPDGSERRVGVEIELGGLRVEQTADIVVQCFGGTHRPDGPHQLLVEGTEIGDIEIEVDSRFIKQEKHRELLETLGVDAGSPITETVDKWVIEAASALVPCEIVTGPITLEQMSRLEELRTRLRLAGAEGTAAEPWYAFGVHFNPTLPGHDADTLLGFLQAFCLLEDWIREDGKVDWSRRISPYVDPFPDKYRRKVLETEPGLSLEQLIDDYLELNPSRNRGLDMLPAFSFLDEDRVRAKVEDELVSKRPTFHYRLADCRVDEPKWTLASEWNRWVAVERLAHDDARRRQMIAERLEGRG